jgi:DNA-directed RNA polymerase specialized sigma24 family protein
MTFVKIEGRYMTIREISEKYNVPLNLIRARIARGIRDINELTQPKYEMTRK